MLLVARQPVLLSRQSWGGPKQVLPPCTAEFSDAACPHGPALPMCCPALASQAGPEGLQSTQLQGKATTPQSQVCVRQNVLATPERPQQWDSVQPPFLITHKAGTGQEQTGHQKRQGEAALRAVSPLQESYLVTVASPQMTESPCTGHPGVGDPSWTLCAPQHTGKIPNNRHHSW